MCHNFAGPPLYPLQPQIVLGFDSIEPSSSIHGSFAPNSSSPPHIKIEPNGEKSFPRSMNRRRTCTNFRPNTNHSPTGRYNKRKERKEEIRTKENTCIRRSCFCVNSNPYYLHTLANRRPFLNRWQAGGPKAALVISRLIIILASSSFATHEQAEADRERF